MTKQVRHIRTSKKGKKFQAGSKPRKAGVLIKAGKKILKYDLWGILFAQETEKDLLKKGIISKEDYDKHMKKLKMHEANTREKIALVNKAYP